MKKFGELLIEQGYIIHDQLTEALAVQENRKRKIGEVMLHRGVFTPEVLEEVLRRQQEDHAKRKFGEVAVSLGLVPAMEVEMAASLQKTGSGLLGEILIAMGYISPDQQHEISTKQQQA